MTDLFVIAAAHWLRQLVFGLGPLFAMGFLLFWLQRWTQRCVVRVVGWRGVVYGTGWIGTPIHEASHVLVGTLFGVEIYEVKLYAPDPVSRVLGYVNYRIPQLSLGELRPVVGTFLMGIAPLFGGALALLVVRFLLVDSEIDRAFAQSAQALAGQLPAGDLQTLPAAFANLMAASYAPVLDHPQNPWLWLYVYLSLAIGTHLAPSAEDLRGGRRGLIVLLLLSYFANVFALLIDAEPARATALLAQISAPMVTLLAFAFSLNLGLGAVAFALALLRRTLSMR
ncbi:MAG: hypothetical protein AAF449_11140 [Myxococcota bacterium]